MCGDVFVYVFVYSLWTANWGVIKWNCRKEHPLNINTATDKMKINGKCDSVKRICSDSLTDHLVNEPARSIETWEGWLWLFAVARSVSLSLATRHIRSATGPYPFGNALVRSELIQSTICPLCALKWRTNESWCVAWLRFALQSAATNGWEIRHKIRQQSVWVLTARAIHANARIWWSWHSHLHSSLQFSCKNPDYPVVVARDWSERKEAIGRKVGNMEPKPTPDCRRSFAAQHRHRTNLD